MRTSLEQRKKSEDFLLIVPHFKPSITNKTSSSCSSLFLIPFRKHPLYLPVCLVRIEPPAGIRVESNATGKAHGLHCWFRQVPTVAVVGGFRQRKGQRVSEVQDSAVPAIAKAVAHDHGVVLAARGGRRAGGQQRAGRRW